MGSGCNYFQKYSIKISYKNNCGSGVIFKAGGNNIVLTAFHIIDGNDEFNDTDLLFERTINGQENSIVFKIENTAFDKEKDLCVFVIDSQETIYELKLLQPKMDQKIKMYGYPIILEDSKGLKSYGLDGKISEINQKQLYVTISDKLGSFDTEEKDTLNGFSGSGFYLLSGETVRLCGIETNVLKKSVPYNAVCGASAEAIVEICSRVNVEASTLLMEDSVSDVVKQSDLYLSQLVPLDDFVIKSKSYHNLESEYREGINAHPEHIRKCLDVPRDRWIDQIEKKFSKSPVIVIRGASGQGKTSLAYRYLIGHYSEKEVLIVQRLSNENSIWSIIRFLKTILHNRKYILYYDVQPGDLFWGQFLNAILNYLPDIPLLITVREDDYNSSDIIHGNSFHGEIVLELCEDEAREIYNRYEQNVFLSFEDLWKNYGCGVPLLEFIYLLNHSTTLEEKINSQITNINENFEEREWFSALASIAIAGQYDISIRLDKLFEIIKVKNVSRVLQQFEREFFVKISDDGERIKCLHSVRAGLIIKALERKFGFDYLNSLLQTLSVIDYSIVYLLLDYIVKNGVNIELIDKLSGISFIDLSVAEDVLRGLLWFSVVEYLRINKEVIEEGNRLCGNNYVMLALGDITGFIDTKDTVCSLLSIIDKQKPGISDRIKEIINKQPHRYLEYIYPKRFLNNIADYITKYVARNPVNERSLGYILFWAYKLGISININSIITVRDDKDYVGISELVKGLIYQRLFLKADEIKSVFEKEILSDANIVSLFIKDNEIFAEVIPNYYTESKGNNILKSSAFNDKCMYAVDRLACLYPNMQRYNVQLLVTRIGEITVPDTEKHIPIGNLPDKWITELNRIGHQLQEYTNSAKNWKDVFDNISSYRNMITGLFEELLTQLGRFYKKGVFENSKINKTLTLLKKQKGFELPKCARDKYGINNDSGSLKSKNQNNNLTSSGEIKLSGRHKHIWFGDICEKYFTGINNYVDGLYRMMEGLYNNTNDFCRLPLYNIVSSYEIYSLFCAENIAFFAAYEDKVDIDREKMTLEKVVAITHWIYNNGYHRENNLVYDAYELFKKRKRAIDGYLKHDIKDYPEVNSFEISGGTIIIHTTISLSDFLIDKIYSDLKKLVGDSRTISPYRGYLLNEIRDISIVLSDDKYKDFLTINIPIKNFTSAVDIDQLRKFILGADSNYSYTPPEYLRTGAITSVVFICEQIIQIGEALIRMSQYSLPKSIDAINKSIKSEITEIAKTIKEFPEYEDLFQDIIRIRSLKLITVDEIEFINNLEIICSFISKYATDSQLMIKGFNT